MFLFNVVHAVLLCSFLVVAAAVAVAVVVVASTREKLKIFLFCLPISVCLLPLLLLFATLLFKSRTCKRIDYYVRNGGIFRNYVASLTEKFVEKNCCKNKPTENCTANGYREGKKLSLLF